jgi:hypothetical protein
MSQMENTQLCMRDGVIPADHCCPICGEGLTSVGHDLVIILVTTTDRD